MRVWSTLDGESTIVGLPPGVILKWSGLLANIPPGWQLCDGTNGSPDLRSKFVKGTAAGVDPGGTGGAASQSYTPAGTFSGTPATLTGAVSWPAGVPTFAGGSDTSSSVSGGTPAGTVSFPIAVPTFAGTPATLTGTVAAIAATGTAAKLGGTSIGNNVADNLHTHPAPALTMNPYTPGGAISWPASAPTFAGSALAGHTHTLIPTGTVSWPAGVPTVAMDSYTPAGTFAGTPATIATEPVYYAVAFIYKL